MANSPNTNDDAFNATLATPPWTAEDERDERERRHEQRMAKLWGKVTRWFMAAVLIASLVLGWMFRWQTMELARGDGPGTAYMVNRWTGEIRFLRLYEWSLVEQAK